MSSVSAEDVRPGPDSLAFRLAINSSVVLYHRPDVLAQAMTLLRREGYHVIEVDASGWSSAGDMHDAISRALDFPEPYRRNLDALNECLLHVAKVVAKETNQH